MTEIDETISKNGSYPSMIGGESTIGDGDTPEEGPPEPAGAPSFQSELALAMQSVAARERERITADAAEDATAQAERARSDAAAEAEAFRLVAEEDVAEIEAWAETEMERIRADAAQRVANRRADLDLSLAQQEVVLQTEIEAVEAAIAAYSQTLDTYFEDLSLETDPEEIARRSGSLPRRPDIESVRAVARAQALTSIAEQAAGADETSGIAEETAEVAAETAEVEDDIDTAAIDRPTDELVEASAYASDTTGAEADGTEADEVPVEVAAASGATGDGWSNVASVSHMADTASATGDDPWTTPTPSPGATRTGWETDTSFIDQGSRPVAVMDPDAAASSAWPTVTATEVLAESPAESPAEAPAEAATFGHPNAAVRLIRSVAPWTAPTRTHEDEPGPHH